MADPHRTAAAIGNLGPGGVRLAQYLGLRRDLFAPDSCEALSLPPPAEPAPPAEALSILSAELGPSRATLVTAWITVPDGNPLAWTAQGFADGRELRVRVALPDRVPAPATIAAAVALVLPWLAATDRDAVGEALRGDLARWIAADTDTAGQHRHLARWRGLALGRTGTIVARPVDAWAGGHVLAIAVPEGLPLPQVIALLADGDYATCEAHDIDPPTTARRLIEAALEQTTLFEAIPVEPRLDHLTVLPGDRIARIGIGAVEPLTPALQTAIGPIARAVFARDPALVAARLAALLVPRPGADPQALADRLEGSLQGYATAAPNALLGDMLDAACTSGFAVPADLLALGRWLAATIGAAIAIDPAIDVAETARQFLLRREIEAAALPDSAEAARRVLAVLAPLEVLPGRLDRLLADAGNRHHRWPVEQHRSPEDRRLHIAQARLLAVAIGWTGIALLLLVVRDLPSEIGRSLLAALLWSGSAIAAVLFLVQWRRSR